MPATKSEKSISSTKSRSLTLMSFETASLVEYARQNEVSISNSSKFMVKVKVKKQQMIQMYLYLSSCYKFMVNLVD